VSLRVVTGDDGSLGYPHKRRSLTFRASNYEFVLLECLDRACGRCVQEGFILRAFNVQGHNVTLKPPRSATSACDALAKSVTDEPLRTYLRNEYAVCAE
jgi:hypothetical protein